MILQALIADETTPEQMAELAQGKLRRKRDLLSRSLQGRIKPHHRFVLSELLLQIDGLEETIKKFDEQIREYCHPFEEVVVLLDTIPGVARRTAEVIGSEIGVNMNRFPTANHLASWAGVEPGNNESAGRRLSGKTTKGNRALVSALTQSAHAASRMKNTYLSAQFHRLAGRRGKKKAIIAVAHSILIMSYHMIKNKEPYSEMGSDFFDKRNAQATTNRMVRRLEQLGYKVNLESLIPVTA
jgi:transposase